MKFGSGFHLFFMMILLAVGARAVAESPRFELLHLWAVKEEQYALKAFSDPVRAMGVDWQEQVLESNFDGVREEYAERLSLGLAPTGAFWIGGGNALDQMIGGGIFRTIPSAWAKESFQNLFRQEIYSNIHQVNGISSLPLGIHLQNYLAYNKKILTDLSLEFPADWEAFLELAEDLKNAGIVPLSMSDQHWQLRFLFTSILADYITADDMQNILGGGEFDEGLTTPIRRSLEIFKRLKPYTNSDHANLYWQDAVDLVKSNRAFANILGDFVAPIYKDNDDIECGLPFGNAYLLWSFDTIVFTNTDNLSEIEGQQALLNSVLDLDAYMQYIARKGGVSVLEGINLDVLERCSLISHQLWNKTTDKVLLTSTAWGGDLSLLGSVLSDFWADDSASIDDTVTVIRNLLD